MNQKTLSWLFCAILLTNQPAFAENSVRIKSNNSSTAKAEEKKVGGFTLNAAIAKALAQSPRLQAFGSAVAAAKGEHRQAGVWTNPEASVEAENFGGGGDFRGFKSTEVTYGISQEIQIGGKVSARENVAGKGVEIASLERQAAVLDLIRDVTIAYAEAVAAEEKVRLASDQKALAEDVLKSVSVRVGAAAAPLIQKSRAEVELSTAAISLDSAKRERDILRKNLGVLLGDEQFTSTLDSSAYYSISKPENAGLEDRLKANPSIAKLSASLEQSKARFELERANAVPNPRVNVGVRDFRESGNQAFLVGVSLPIPVFDANRGNIEKARGEMNKTLQENRDTALSVNAELTQAEQQEANAYLKAETLKTEILPSADKAFKLAREGYGLGRFPYLEVLDAQRSLFGVKQQHIDALKEYHTARAKVERLTAAHIARTNEVGGANVE